MASKPTLILASTSKYRQQLLRRLGLAFTAVAPAYEEEHGLPLPPAELVAYLSRRKAESLRLAYPDAVIIGSDQAVAFEGDILGKPGTAENAAQQLLWLSGKTHELLTGLCVLTPDERRWEHLEVVRLRMRTLSAAMVEHYVSVDQPLDCAGAYKIESLGVALFEHVEGNDPTSIEGLPLMALTRCLAELGMDPLGPAESAQ